MSIRSVIERAAKDASCNAALQDQYVRFEVLLGVEDILGRVASARNFSKTLKPVSLASYEKKLDWLKQAVHPYADQVRWSENGAGQNSENIDALELIQMLVAMNVGQFGPSDHPVESYKNAGKCLDYITDDDDKWGYKKLSPVALDIWSLYDTMRYKWWTLYNMKDEETGKYGRGGSTREVKERKRGKAKLMHYVTLGEHGDPSRGDKHVEKGLAFPLLAGFRALLVEGPDGFYTWAENPIDFFEQHGQSLIRKIMDISDQRGNDPHTVGRDKTVYAQVYEWIENERTRQAFEVTREAYEALKNELERLRAQSNGQTTANTLPF
jgi:hypothetical protein